MSTAAVLLVGSHVLPATQIGTLAAAYFLLQLAFQPLQELSDVYGQLQSAAAAMVKISSVLDAEPEIHDAEGARRLPRIEGDVELDRVVFAYGKEPVLHSVEVHGAEFCADVAREAAAVGAKALWLQLGIVSPEARIVARDSGMDYVEDACTLVVHRRELR